MTHLFLTIPEIAAIMFYYRSQMNYGLTSPSDL